MHKPILKNISMILVASFLLQDISWAAPELLSQVLNNSTQKIELSSEFSKITADHQGKLPKHIIHIQDAHTNLSAQKNISKVIEELVTRYKVQTVFVEGGTKDDSLTFLRPLADKATRERVAKKYMIQGEMAGEEYLSLSSDLDFKIIGVEDLSLYKKDLEYYRSVAHSRDKIFNYLHEIDKRADTLKRQLYHESLLDLDQVVEKFEKKEADFTEYYDALSGEAKKAGVNLLGYPQFLMLGELKAKESQIDFKIANDEQAAVFQELQKAKPDLAQELKEIAGKTQKMKRGSLALGSFYERLLNESKQLTLETPELIKYAEYLDLYGRLHFEALLLETQTLERDTFMRSLSSVQAVALYESSAYLKRLRSLFSLQATREDVDAYLEARKEDRFRIVSVLAFLNRTLYDLGREAEVLPYDSIIEDDLKTVEGFYEATRERDQVFVQKALDQMDKQKISSAVLITGGYHTSNLKKLLADRGVSYTVVTPHVFEETNITRYEKLLLSQFGASGSMGSAPMLNFHRAKSFMKLAPGVERPGFVDAARLDLEGHNGARLSQDTTPGKAEAAHVETVRSLLKSVTGLEDGRIAEAVKDLKKFDLRNLKERADQLSGRRRMIKELKGGPLRLTRESKKALYVLIYDGISLEVLEKLDDAQVVLRAIADLGELGTPHALDLIMAVYEQTKAEPRFRVQRAAIQALEKNKPFYERQALQDPQMQPFLDQLLKYLNKISSEDEGADQELAAQIWDKVYDMAQGDMIRFADSSDPDNSRVGLFRSTEDDVDEGVIHISSGGERYTYQVGQDGVWRRGEHRLLSIGARLAANKRVNRWVLAAPLLALGIYTPGFIRSRVKRAELKKEEHRLAVKEALRPFLEGFELSAPAASIKPAHTITTIKVAITDPLNEAELEKMTQQILKVQANSPARSYDKIFLSEARVRQLVRNRQVLTVNAVVDGEYRIVAAIFFNVSKMGKIKKYSQISDPEKHDIIRGDVLYDFWVITDDDYKKVSAIPFADTLVHQTAELAERAGWVVMAYSRPGELYKRLGPTEKRFINKFWDRPFVRAYRARIAIQHLLKARLDRDEAYSTKPFEKWLAAKYKIDTYGKSKIAKDLRTILSPSLKTNTIDPSKNTEITKLIGLLFMQFVSEVRGLDLMDPALGKLHTRLGGHMVAIYFSRDEDENALGMNVIMSYEAVNDIDNEINRLMYIMGYSKRVSGARLSVLNGDKGLAKKNKVLFDRADTLLSDREVRAIREQVIVDAKGISLGSVIALLHEAGIWNLMNGKPVSMDQIVDLATKRMGGANEGYLHGALSSLESEGFLTSRTPKPDIRDERAYLNHKIFELTDKGRLMLELAPAYVKASQLIPVLKRMTEYLMGPETTGPPLELGSDTDLSSILNDIRELKMKYSDAAHLTAINHIEGMIVGPISIAFRRAIFEEGIADLENSFDLSAIPGGHIDRLRIAAQFLADRGSLTIDGDRAQFTPRGIVALSKAGAYGVPASYDQSYEWETSRIFLFGTPAELAQMAAKNLENIKQFGKEWLVDRELNVWGSEMAHETYKTLLREALLLMFNLPLELQPKVFTGIGVGTGWFEIFAYQTMRDGRHGEGTLRWKNIKTNPLVIIGADLNEVSLKITEARYKEAGIPYFSVVQADISKLAEFKQKVDMELIQLQARRPDLYPGQKLTSADSSFETTMLIHNRPFVDPTRMEGEGLSDAEIVQLVDEFGVTETFVGPDGRSITIFDHIQNLYKHFMSWKKLGGPLGLLTLELFSVDPKIAALHPTRSMDGTYRWTHTVSNQLLVRWKLWLAVAKKAGLVSISQVQAVKPDKPTDDLGATGVFWLVPQESAADLQSHLAGAQSAEGARLASESDHDLSALNLERERLEADLALSHTQAGLVRHSIATLETELGNIKKASGSELADKTKRMNEIGAEISGLNKDLENFRGQAEAINAALRLLNQKIKAAVRALELQERSLWQTAMDNLAELLMQAPDNLVWTELARYLRESKDGFGAGPVTGIISFLQRNRSQLSSMSDLTEVFEGSSSAALSIKLRKLLEQMDNQPILVRIRAAQEREREREAEDYLSEADSAAVMAQIEQTIRVNDLTTEEKALLQQQLDVLTGHHEKLPRMTRAARDHVREILGEIADREKSWKSGSAVSRNLPRSARIFVNYVVFKRFDDSLIKASTFDNFKRKAFDERGYPIEDIKARFIRFVNGKKTILSVDPDFAFEAAGILRERQDGPPKPIAVKVEPLKKTPQEEAVDQFIQTEGVLNARIQEAQSKEESADHNGALTVRVQTDALWQGLSESVAAYEASEQSLTEAMHDQLIAQFDRVDTARLDNISRISSLVHAAVGQFVDGLPHKRIQESTLSSGASIKLQALETELVGWLPAGIGEELRRAAIMTLISKLNEKVAPDIKTPPIVTVTPVAPQMRPQAVQYRETSGPLEYVMAIQMELQNQDPDLSFVAAMLNEIPETNSMRGSAVGSIHTWAASLSETEGSVLRLQAAAEYLGDAMLADEITLRQKRGYAADKHDAGPEKRTLPKLDWIEPTADQARDVRRILATYLGEEALAKATGDMAIEKQVFQWVAPRVELYPNQIMNALGVLMIVPGAVKANKEKFVSDLRDAVRSPEQRLEETLLKKMLDKTRKRGAGLMLWQIRQKYRPEYVKGKAESVFKIADVDVSDERPSDADDTSQSAADYTWVLDEQGYPIDIQNMKLTVEDIDDDNHYVNYLSYLAQTMMIVRLLEVNRTHPQYTLKNIQDLAAMRYFYVMAAWWLIKNQHQLGLESQSYLQFSSVIVMMEILHSKQDLFEKIMTVLGHETAMGAEWALYTREYEAVRNRPGQDQSPLAEAMRIVHRMTADTKMADVYKEPIFAYWVQEFLSETAKLMNSGKLILASGQQDKTTEDPTDIFNDMMYEQNRLIQIFADYRAGILKIKPTHNLMRVVEDINDEMMKMPPGKSYKVSEELMQHLEIALSDRYTRQEVRDAFELNLYRLNRRAPRFGSLPFHLASIDEVMRIKESKESLEGLLGGRRLDEGRTHISIVLTPYKNEVKQASPIKAVERVKQIFYVPHERNPLQDILIFISAKGDKKVVTAEGDFYTISQPVIENGVLRFTAAPLKTGLTTQDMMLSVNHRISPDLFLSSSGSGTILDGQQTRKFVIDDPVIVQAWQSASQSGEKVAGARLTTIIDVEQRGYFTPDGRDILLVAEDSPDIRMPFLMLLQRHLRNAGKENVVIVMVDDLEAAFKAYDTASKSGTLKYVITDNRYPTGSVDIPENMESGTHFYHFVKQDSKAPIFMMSSGQRPGSVSRQEFADKGFDTEKMIQAVVSSLGARLSAKGQGDFVSAIKIDHYTSGLARVASKQEALKVLRAILRSRAGWIYAARDPEGVTQQTATEGFTISVDHANIYSSVMLEDESYEWADQGLLDHYTMVVNAAGGIYLMSPDESDENRQFLESLPKISADKLISGAAKKPAQGSELIYEKHRASKFLFDLIRKDNFPELVIRIQNSSTTVSIKVKDNWNAFNHARDQMMTIPSQMVRLQFDHQKQELKISAASASDIARRGARLARRNLNESEVLSRLAQTKEPRVRLRLADMLFADTRPISSGLLDAVYVLHDMKVRSLVNPLGQAKTALYKGAGADISNFLLTINAPYADFESYYYGLDDLDLALIRHAPLIGLADSEYSLAKFDGGFGLVRYMTDLEETLIALTIELNGMGVDFKTIRTDIDDRGYPRLSFVWANRMRAPQRYYISFIDLFSGDKPQYRDKYDIFYQRAGIDIAEGYVSREGRPSYMYDVASRLEPEGFFVTDDFTSRPSALQDNAFVLDYADRFPFLLPEIPFANEQLYEDAVRRLRTYIEDGSRDDNYFYGWKVRVRQNTADGKLAPNPRAQIVDAKPTDPSQWSEGDWVYPIDVITGKVNGEARQIVNIEDEMAQFAGENARIGLKVLTKRYVKKDDAASLGARLALSQRLIDVFKVLASDDLKSIGVAIEWLPDQKIRFTLPYIPGADINKPFDEFARAAEKDAKITYAVIDLPSSQGGGRIYTFFPDEAQYQELKLAAGITPAWLDAEPLRDRMDILNALAIRDGQIDLGVGAIAAKVLGDVAVIVLNEKKMNVYRKANGGWRFVGSSDHMDRGIHEDGSPAPILFGIYLVNGDYMVVSVEGPLSKYTRPAAAYSAEYANKSLKPIRYVTLKTHIVTTNSTTPLKRHIARWVRPDSVSVDEENKLVQFIDHRGHTIQYDLVTGEPVGARLARSTKFDPKTGRGFFYANADRPDVVQESQRRMGILEDRAEPNSNRIQQVDDGLDDTSKIGARLAASNNVSLVAGKLIPMIVNKMVVLFAFTKDAWAATRVDNFDRLTGVVVGRGELGSIRKDDVTVPDISSSEILTREKTDLHAVTAAIPANLMNGTHLKNVEVPVGALSREAAEAFIMMLSNIHKSPYGARTRFYLEIEAEQTGMWKMLLDGRSDFIFTGSAPKDEGVTIRLVSTEQETTLSTDGIINLPLGRGEWIGQAILMLAAAAGDLLAPSGKFESQFLKVTDIPEAFEAGFNSLSTKRAGVDTIRDITTGAAKWQTFVEYQLKPVLQQILNEARTLSILRRYLQSAA